MVSGVVRELQRIDLVHYLSPLTSAIEQARRDSNIELWSANLEAMNKELNTLTDTIDRDVNHTIIPGFAQLQQRLLAHVHHYETELAKQGIAISDHEVVELSRRRRLRFSFTYPSFARTRRLKRMDLEFGQNLGHIGAGVAKTGGSVGGLLVGAALAGIAVAMHGQKRSKAIRLLEEVTGQVYEHHAAVEELVIMTKAYGGEVRQVMMMFAECLDAMEAASDTNLLRYHVTEGKLLLTIEGIGRR